MYSINLIGVFSGFFSSADSELAKTFSKVASALSSEMRFAHTSNADVLKKQGYKE
jgi:hypothetical protein